MPDATINGYKHHWEDLGSGEALVMFHGAAGSGVSLLNHAQEMAKDFRVLVPDMRGLGQSARQNPIPADAWVEDLVGLLDHLGIEKAHVYGTSLGSRVALKFGIAHPERTASVILDNAILAFEEAGSTVMNQRLGNPDAMDDEQRARFHGMHGDDWKEAVLSYYTWRNDPAAHAYYDMREGSKSMSVPLFITRGDAREPVHPMAHSIELFNNVAGSRLWIKPEGGAFATAEGYDRVRKFIAETKDAPVAAAAH
jgi:pimeloyl-ACP methyl ester carboxylesterase